MRVPKQDTLSREPNSSEQQPKALPTQVSSKDTSQHPVAMESVTGEFRCQGRIRDEQVAFAPSRSKSTADANSAQLNTKIAVFTLPTRRSPDLYRTGDEVYTQTTIDCTNSASLPVAVALMQEEDPWRAQDNCLMDTERSERAAYNFHIGMANTAEVLREQRPLLQAQPGAPPTSE